MWKMNFQISGVSFTDTPPICDEVAHSPNTSRPKNWLASLKGLGKYVLPHGILVFSQKQLWHLGLFLLALLTSNTKFANYALRPLLMNNLRCWGVSTIQI